MTRIAFIGVGTMGLPIARNLLAAGHKLVLCDVDPTRAAVLGVEVARTSREAVAEADVVILSLPSPAAVEDVTLGPAGVRTGARPGTLLIDMSTSPPALARRLAAELGAGGIHVLDAPVSGGPRGAEEGTLTVMVGGHEDAFARAEPLFRAVGRHVVRVGGHGAGQAAKLCNNLIAGATMAAIAEACAVAEQEGLGELEGRQSDEQITVFDSTGIALQDSATVPLEYERARAAGVGVEKKMIST